MNLSKRWNLVLMFFIMVSCKKNDYDAYTYEFVKPYCSTVNSGGVVGPFEKCYAVGDQVKGKRTKDGIVSIRIAKHVKGNRSQETLDIPYVNLKILTRN